MKSTSLNAVYGLENKRSKIDLFCSMMVLDDREPYGFKMIECKNRQQWIENKKLHKGNITDIVVYHKGNSSGWHIDSFAMCLADLEG